MNLHTRLRRLCRGKRKQDTLEILSSLSYRTGQLKEYLQEIANYVHQLIEVDVCVVTLCQEGFAQVLASSAGGEDNQTSSLHGQLAGTVVNTGRSLIVENTKTCTKYGQAPAGFLAYLGIPLRTSQGKVIGTICSFHRQSRRFSGQEVRIVELFAERAATAIDNYFLFEQQRQFNQILEVEVARRTEELKVAQSKLIQQEKLAAIGEFATGIIHEIRNPLTTMKMGLNYFRKLDLSVQSQERLYLALAESERLERLLREILLYAKPQRLNISRINLDELVVQTVHVLQMTPEVIDRYIEYENNDEGKEENDLMMEIDADKIKQVLVNLVRNACEAIEVGDRVKLRVKTDVDLQHVFITIWNGGSPITTEILAKMTQPFFSTKSSGTGLGLAIVKRIIDAHYGRLSIESSAESGTTVTVMLPRKWRV